MRRDHRIYDTQMCRSCVPVGLRRGQDVEKQCRGRKLPLLHDTSRPKIPLHGHLTFLPFFSFFHLDSLIFSSECLSDYIFNLPKCIFLVVAPEHRLHARRVGLHPHPQLLLADNRPNERRGKGAVQAGRGQETREDALRAVREAQGLPAGVQYVATPVYSARATGSLMRSSGSFESGFRNRWKLDRDSAAREKLFLIRRKLISAPARPCRSIHARKHPAVGGRHQRQQHLVQEVRHPAIRRLRPAVRHSALCERATESRARRGHFDARCVGTTPSEESLYGFDPPTVRAAIVVHSLFFPAPRDPQCTQNEADLTPPLRNDPRARPPALPGGLAPQPAARRLRRGAGLVAERRVPLGARVLRAQPVARGAAPPGLRAPPRRPVAGRPPRGPRRRAGG